jgi:SNF2 family DNA or RNA helicase
VFLPLSDPAEYRRAAADVTAYCGEQAAQDKTFRAEVAEMPVEERSEAIRVRQQSAEHKAAQAEQLTRINALRQLIARLKLPAAIEWLENFVDTGEKIVVFAWHQEIVKALADHFGAATIMGGDSMAARQESVDRFQADPKCQVLVCNILAAGVGLTLTAASNVAFVELEWRPAMLDQAYDRIHRIGQEAESTTGWYLLGNGDDTIDTEMWSLIEKKRAITEGAVATTEDSDSVLTTYLHRQREVSGATGYRLETTKEGSSMKTAMTLPALMTEVQRQQDTKVDFEAHA